MALKWADVLCQPYQFGGRSGRIGYVTPAVWGVPNASARGTKSEVAHKGAYGYSTRAVWGHKRRVWLPYPWAKAPLLSRGSPIIESKEKRRSGPELGGFCYIARAFMGVARASVQGKKSEVAHNKEDFLRHPYPLGRAQRLSAGDKVGSGPQGSIWLRHPCRLGTQLGRLASLPMGYVATSL